MYKKGKVDLDGGRGNKLIQKEDLLELIGEEAIFEKYLGILPNKDFIVNPLRDDKDAGCNFYHNGTKWKFHDWSTGFNEDCFGIAIAYHNCLFSDVFDLIAKDFGVFDFLTGKTDHYTLVKKEVDINLIEKFRTKRIIKIVSRKANFMDDAFWKDRYYLTKEVLNLYKVTPVLSYTIDDAFLYYYSTRDPAYAYPFPDDTYKIYFPYRKNKKKDRYSPRFLSNSHYLQGYTQLDKEGDVLFITKSLKDVMVFRLLGFNAVAPHTESTFVEPEKIAELKKRFNKLIIFYDNDKAGLKHADKYSEEYAITYTYIPKEELANGIKDISDYIEEYGTNESLNLIYEICQIN